MQPSVQTTELVQLKQDFKQIDTNRDGRVDKSEML